MKIKKVLVLALLIVSVLALTVASQMSQVTSTISVEEVKTCTTNFYNEVQDVYGNYNYYHNYSLCLNTSGPNTDCSTQQDILNLTGKLVQVTVTKNSTECTPPNKYIVSIDKGATTEKKEIDFSDWGPCIYNAENNCLIVTCVSNEDGAFKGQFTDCKGGKSCQRFEICDNSIKTFYKNSRDNFVENDPSFYLGKLILTEVTK